MSYKNIDIYFNHTDGQRNYFCFDVSVQYGKGSSKKVFFFHEIAFAQIHGVGDTAKHLVAGVVDIGEETSKRRKFNNRR